MALKVHPGIGIARIGDSAEFFVGPETVDLPDIPVGGYRDDNLRIRRQAGRFRLFDHPGGNAFTAIVDSPNTSISWTVTLRQRAVGSPTGLATVTGTNANAVIAAGGVTLGELRTDADGNLLVLS
ncbi:MAG TPA: LodA/GoxA family CTQ-dependent oxidase, partial [Steroidobacteraceae bacterium]|nr:LodA/GoxA family CTQ-dependent oxidase [Steroidobacteraceae bacterium]